LCDVTLQFLTDYQDDKGDYVYAQHIMDMCARNEQSLPVSYLHLSRHVPILAIWVADAPHLLLGK
jgi:DNA replication licensing factor MCM2